jgi:hypothetical protein
MLRRIVGVTGISLWAGLITVVVLWGFRASASGEQMFEKLPEGWKVEKSFVVPKAQTMAISRKLGSRISKLTNTVLLIEGKRLQVNVFHCPIPNAAAKIYKAVLEAHSGLTGHVARDGNLVIEFAKSDDINLMNQVRGALGLETIKLDSASRKFIKKIPAGWQIENSFVVPRNQTVAIGKKLGVHIKNLSNTIFSVQGKRFQVNVIECVTMAEAEKVHRSILKMKGDPAFCIKLDDSVVEFVGDDVELAIKAAWELGLKPKPTEAKYRISFEAAPIVRCDYMSWNKLFNLFVQASGGTDSQTARSQISQLSKRFDFGSEIVLRTCGTGKDKPTYLFKPPAAAARPLAHGDTTKYTFRNLPLKVGVPFVSIMAIVHATEPANLPTTRRVDNELLRPTQFWPSDAPRIMALAKKITSGCRNQQDKVNNILQWLQPGKNIEFGGPVIGSRYGVERTLKQGFGQCWDFSDCFITFCRALGIPCRQVAGWFYGQSGHIWAEVLVEGEEWRQVDPTGGVVLECGIYHIPYLTSEDGGMPILYLSMPKIELVD